MGAPLTPTSEARAELEAKGSRFLGYLIPVSCFDDRLDALRAEHRKASHFVTATRRMASNDQVEDRARDDGEPGGTAGMPVLRVMTGANIVEAGIVVVRYFGGTKLGTGGLARAYSGAAARAIDAASLTPFVRYGTRELHCLFAEISDLERAVETLGLVVDSRTFTEDGATLVLSTLR